MQNKMNHENSGIKCNVDTCSYNRDNACTASMIEVNPTDAGDGVAKTSEGTLCTTFVPNEKA